LSTGRSTRSWLFTLARPQGGSPSGHDESALPEWEFVPEGWERARREAAPEGGWEDGDVAEAYRQKWPEFLKAVDGPGALGIDHEVPLDSPIGRDDPSAQNIILAWAYALSRAAGWALNRDELLEAASECGLTLVREFVSLYTHMIEGTPEPVTDGGFLFRRETEGA
jgi:hypothetical protein